MTDIQKLQALVTKSQGAIQKKLARQGYVENLGMTELRRIEDAAMKIAHNHSADWNSRQLAGQVVSDFDQWLNNL